MMDRVIIVFLRVPEKGRVKTRLSVFLNDTFVLKLYKGLVKDTLDVIETSGDNALYFWPPGKKEVLQKWLGNKYAFAVQKGDNLGQKMSNAFVDMFEKGYTYALLIGTDIPELSVNMITLAYQELQTADAVIGPSDDGGYYLIGFQKSEFSKNVFEGIDWSTTLVLNQTLGNMERESIQYHLLPGLNDIDTPKDFDALSCRVKYGGKIGKRTLEMLNSYEN